MRKKVLITGASGFVGYHLIIEALQSGLEVHAAVRPSSRVEHLSALDVHYTTLDFTSIECLKRDIESKQYHYIIHAAGITKAKTPEIYQKVNAGYSKNLAMAASQADVPLEKFIYVSSLAAIGPLSGLAGQIDEATAPKPLTSYGKSKLLAEQYVIENDRLPWLIIRPTAVYGPREKDILILFKVINRGFEPYIGSFNQQLSFIYVKDLSKAVIRALFSAHVKKVYNISDGKIYNRYDLANVTKQILHKKTLKLHLPVPLVRYMAIFLEKVYERRKAVPALNMEKMYELTAVNWSCDIRKLEQELGYFPQTLLEEGLEETLNWYKVNKWL